MNEDTRRLIRKTKKAHLILKANPIEDIRPKFWQTLSIGNIEIWKNKK